MAKSYSFHVGDLNCAALYDNHRMVQLRTVFPNVSDTDYARAINEHAFSEELEVGFNVLYVKVDGKHVLIDAGMGSWQLTASLATLGLTPEAIDAIIVTHNDGDHIGGLKSFPNAEIIMVKEAWDLWTNANSRRGMVEEFIKLFRDDLSQEELAARASSREDYGATVLPSLKERVRLVKANEELFSGIKLIAAFGHRSDHYAVHLNSAGESLIHVVDSIRHPLQVNYNWASYIDSYPEAIIKTNQSLLKDIIAQNALIFGAHFPYPALARVQEAIGKKQWQWIDSE